MKDILFSFTKMAVLWITLLVAFKTGNERELQPFFGGKLSVGCSGTDVYAFHKHMMYH